ncbi:MAG: energy-converting hydrogenase B subunit G EhbG [Methanobrevibacter sp.]|jgi:energy-converting hydrogenase B subunit G|nr:energy-converting hydrogenase B subunit G EhbG [Candidatus Methanovirga basalitermitum]
MDLYAMIYSSIKEFKGNIRKDPTTNQNVSSAMAAELTIVSTVLIATIMLRHLNIMLTVLIVLGLGLFLITGMPLINKLKREQNDSLNKMMFYMILTLGILVTSIYWGFKP